MVYPVETILSTFSDWRIPPLEVVPTHEYLTALNNYLNGCAASVHSNLVNGTLGYLVLTDPPTVFAIECSVPFVPHVKPGPTVTITAPPPTAAFVGKITLTHNEYLRVFNEYYNVDKACKKVLSYWRTLDVGTKEQN